LTEWGVPNKAVVLELNTLSGSRKETERFTESAIDNHGVRKSTWILFLAGFDEVLEHLNIIFT
jgi:hypothetical protein